MKATTNPIETKFKPFSLTLEFDNPDEAAALASVLNVGQIADLSFGKEIVIMTLNEMFSPIRKALAQQGINTTAFHSSFVNQLKEAFKPK